MSEDNNNITIPSDPIVEDLKDKINSKPSWTTPCTFDRINRMPIDSKQCFDTYDDLIEYVTDPETTSFPGMFVAVINRNDPRRGAYVLMNSPNPEEEGIQIPVKLGGISSIVIRGDKPDGEDETPEIEATVDPQTGKATIDIDEVQFGDIEVDQLIIDGVDIYDLIPKMAVFKDIEDIPEDETTLDDTVRKLNQIISGLKQIAQSQPFMVQAQEDEPEIENDGE